jgi:uncharacterized protein (TIGR03435 family)
MLEMRHVQVVLAAGCIAAGPSLWAQAAPRAALEVVSIKPHKTLNDAIFTALEEELGLKLVPSKGPVRVLIIDHIERPSPN